MQVTDYERLLVENILKHPAQFKWSVQGLGMMRMYLSDEVRLHIWDSALRVPGVSPMHTHPWNLHSTVVAGRYRQYRYTHSSAGERFNSVQIKCGENACMKEEPVDVRLAEAPIEVYGAGESYTQSKDEIHMSTADDGTVTLVKRTFSPDRDHAYVYWRGAGSWVDAAPRPATDTEVLNVTKRSLTTWFDGVV